MSAIESLLAGLIDYAGLYPPASLDMRTAVRNYLEYRSGRHAYALGRFIVDAARLEELRDAAGPFLADVPLSAIVSVEAGPRQLEDALARGFSVKSIEVKCSEPLTICRISEKLPPHLDRYFEIPLRPGCSGAIDAIASAGACAKLRMGGVSQDAFPLPDDVVACLHLLADRRVPFKGTAGLHHPIRSPHPLTYAPDSSFAVMHGFINLFCAAARAYDGKMSQANAVLEDEDSSAFRITPDCLVWRSCQWTSEQIGTIRKHFFTSFGSCSFAEPLRDLEVLEWL